MCSRCSTIPRAARSSSSRCPRKHRSTSSIETAYSLEDKVGVSLGPVVVNGLYPEIGGLDADAEAAAVEAGTSLRPGEGGLAAARRELPQPPSRAPAGPDRATGRASPAAAAPPAVPVRRRDRAGPARPAGRRPPRWPAGARRRLDGPSPAARRRRAACHDRIVTDAAPGTANPTNLVELVDTSEIIICTGSGGVGKTTIAAVLAMEAARRGRRAVVVTIDPARRLADALGLDGIGNTPKAIAGDWPGELHAVMLDTKSTFDDLVTRYSSDPAQAERILDNRFYRNISGALSGHAGVHGDGEALRAARRLRLRPRGRRHAADPQRARLPRCPAAAHPLPRPPPVPSADGTDARGHASGQRRGPGIHPFGLEGRRRGRVR